MKEFSDEITELRRVREETNRALTAKEEQNLALQERVLEQAKKLAEPGSPNRGGEKFVIDFARIPTSCGPYHSPTIVWGET